MPDFARMLDELQYSLLVMLAGVHWGLQKAVLMAGYTVKLINQFLIENAFVPIISQTNDSLRIAISYVFVVALLVLGITYLLAAFIRLEVVNPRSALLWYTAGIVFFTVGPSFHQGMNTFRMRIAEVMYLSVLDGMNTGAGDFSSLAQVVSNDVGLGVLCDYFDVYLPGATEPGSLDGLDMALAYLRGHAQDVMGYPQPVPSPACPMYLMNPNPSTWAGTGGSSVVPMDWNMPGGYFDHTLSPTNWDTVEETTRDRAVALAGASQQRALTAWPLLVFALIEQVIQLLITMAMGITFVSFGVAILFAFFKRTESIAQNLINQWIELIVQTTIIAVVQALVIGFFLAGAATGSAPAIIGMGLISLVFIVITLWSGVKAVWNSFNRLFNAMGQVSGQVFLTPGSVTSAAATRTAGMVTGGVDTATRVGSNTLAGMMAMQQGATPAQAAGLMLGGFQSLSGAARTLTHLPGLRGTTLGEAAEQFTEGAATRQVAQHVPLVGRAAAPLVGALLLSDRDPHQAETDADGRVLSRPMLVPAVGDLLGNWTQPALTQAKRAAAEDDTDPDTAFTAVSPRRMGVFTPVSAASIEADHRQLSEQQTYAAEMTSEELEQHFSDTLQRSPQSASGASTGDAGTSRLEQSAEALANAARLQMQAVQLLGQLKLKGSGDVASVLGDVLRGLQAERRDSGQPLTGGVDHLTVGHRMAQAMGMTPESGGQPAIQADLARFGLFTDQALRLGLAGPQAEQVIQEVKTSPEGKLTEATRQLLIGQVQQNQGVGHNTAHDEVQRLEHSARMLPDAITAFGWMQVPHLIPASASQAMPTVNVQPQITVQVASRDPAEVEVDALRQADFLSGSDSVLGGEG